MGDSSDGVTGIKGLGAKGLFKKFPELSTRDLSFDDLIDIAESKLKEHVVYARVLHDVDLIADNGEPGFIWLDVARNFGRLADPADGKDYRVMGFNPCIR